MSEEIIDDIDMLVWVEKYRPKTIDECILPEKMKAEFKGFLRKQNVPNLLFKGGAGVGKTTVARAMLEQKGVDYLLVNGSKEMNMEKLRVDITNFVTSVSLNGKRKAILIDEGDGIPIKTQEALRGFMEEHSKNCSWIITCNYSNKIIVPIHSRFTIVDFRLDKDDKPKMAAKFMARIKEILTAESVTFDPKVVAQLLMNYFPDFRRTLNELQRFSVNGTIDEGILSKIVDTDVKDLISSIREKDFKKARQWCENNADADMGVIFQKLYDSLLGMVNEIPQTVLIIADYAYKDYFVLSKSINLCACSVELMSSITFKA